MSKRRDMVISWWVALIFASCCLLLATQVNAEDINNADNLVGQKQVVVAPEQTLWRVAVENAPVNTNPWQMLIAIYKTNPEAFRDGHIGHIITGSQITIPTNEQINLLSAKQAEAEYQQLIKKPLSLVTTSSEVLAIPSPDISSKEVTQTQPMALPQTPEVETQVTRDQPVYDEQLQALRQQLENLQLEMANQQALLVALTSEVKDLQQENQQQQTKPEPTAIPKAEPAAKASPESALQPTSTPAPETIDTESSIEDEVNSVQPVINFDYVWSKLISPQFYPWIVATLCIVTSILLLLVLVLLWSSRTPKRSKKMRTTEPYLSSQTEARDKPPETIFATRGAANVDAHQANKTTSEAEFIAQLLQEREQQSESAGDLDHEYADLSLADEVDKVLQQENRKQNIHEPQQFSSSEDEVLSKLDLAQSYIEMGQVDQARVLLQAVLHEGNLEQQTSATMLLAKLHQD
jgi:FimV-like protein